MQIMSASIAFLVTASQPHNDNHMRLPRIFADAQWRVSQHAHDDLNLRRQTVYLGDRPSKQFDLIWPVGFGPRQNFLDRQQLLAQMDQQRLITPALAYLTLHGKSAWLHFAPTTAVANHTRPLVELLERDGGDWVLKPAAGSLGRQVYKVRTAKEIKQHMHGATTHYWMLQRFIPEIAAGETRTLIFGDVIIGSYLRIPEDGFRANLATQGRASKAHLDDATRDLVNQVHRELATHGVGFAAIDTVGGYLMEVNLANPGGLQTLQQLYGDEVETRLVKALEARLG
jgi:glutathione synthase